MKKRILTILTIVLITLSSTAAIAAAKKKFTIIGLWQTITTIDGIFIHDILTFNRDGTGVEDVYMTKGPENRNVQMPYRWSFSNNVLCMFFENGDIHCNNVVITNRTTFISTQFRGAPQLIGRPLKYELQEHQNEEGCLNETAPDDERIITRKTPTDTVPVPSVKKHRRREFPV
jgi:hypothetical protein